MKVRRVKPYVCVDWVRLFCGVKDSQESRLLEPSQAGLQWRKRVRDDSVFVA